MKKRILLLPVALVLFVGAMLAPEGADAADVSRAARIQTEALFTSTDPSGRFVTDIDVFAIDGVTQFPPGAPEVSRAVDVTVRVTDSVTGEFLLDVSSFAQLEPGAFSADSRLEAGFVRAIIEGFDGVSGSPVEIGVDLELTAIGDTIRELSQFRIHEREFILNAHGLVTERPATALGSVTVDGTNYVSGPSFLAVLTDLKTSDVSISF